MSTFHMIKLVGKARGLCRCYSSKPSLCLKRALIFSKLSRYEFERYRNPNLDEVQLECALRKRGSDYDMLLKHHNLHKDFEQSVVKTFQDNDIETKVVNRFQYDSSLIDWCDVVVPTGGDGTFLLAAGRVLNNEKPVIGLNSDPNRSTGHLCLPKKYSKNLGEVVHKLKNGQFDWKFRSRIRTTLFGEKIFDPPVELHDQELLEPDHRFYDHVTKKQDEKGIGLVQPSSNTRKLPVLALNEVFIGEYLSARVSYFEMRIGGGQPTKVKSSGLCVCTGTGSTSWHLSINRLTSQSVKELLTILNVTDESKAEEVKRKFNDNLVYCADDERMCYTVRDLISVGVWPHPKGLAPRGYASNIEVRSRCFNAGLVIDGGISFNFNDGTIAILEINPSDSLRTVTLHE